MPLAIGLGVSVTDGGAPAATPIVASGLVAEYRFNEGSGTTVTDYANGYNGTVSGTPTWSSQGLTFNASTDQVAFPQANVQIAPQLTHTLMVVCKSPLVNDLLYSEGDGGTEFFYLALTPSVNTIRARYRRETATSYDVSAVNSNTASANTWCCITVRRNGTSADASLNIVFASQGTASPGVAAIPAKTRSWINQAAGAAMPSSALATFGYMLFYYRYLSDAEVTQNYGVLKTRMAVRGVTLP